LGWPGGVGLGPWSVLLSRSRFDSPGASFGELVWLLQKKKKRQISSFFSLRFLVIL